MAGLDLSSAKVSGIMCVLLVATLLRINNNNNNNNNNIKERFYYDVTNVISP